MSKLAKALTAAAGNAGESLYVEDVFSTYLYTGTGSTQSINNGIDLDGEGGTVLLQSRSNDTGTAWNVYDTERGVRKYLRSNSTASESTAGTGAGLTSFNSNGFTLGTSWNTENFSPYTYASWTFRKAEKFFDVVTYTGNGVSGGREISHNLGSSPGFILIKRTDTQTAYSSWMSYHRAGSATGTVAFLNTTNFFFANSRSWFGDGSSAVAPTDTVFTINGGSSNYLNTSGATYIVYLFAHDAGGFGDDGDESIIKCGSFTTDASGSVSVNLGFEPQWLLVKNSQTTENWVLLDNMRGWSFSSQQRLFPNLSNAEQSLTGNYGTPTANGFDFVNGLGNSNDYIYIAIRRPMKTPESGTEVFAAVDDEGSKDHNLGFSPDLTFFKRTDSVGSWLWYDRLRGNSLYLRSNGSNAEATLTNIIDEWTQEGVSVGSNISSGDNYFLGNFKRSPGFFDVVAYTGNTTTQAINHNLGVTPELIIVKARQSNIVWAVWSKSLEQYELLQLNTSNAKNGDVGDYGYWTSTAPTSTQFSVGTYDTANKANEGMIAYLFATLAGVSKVGSYTGTGSNVDVDCGFSAGARFILIKRTDSTGDWYVWDSERGIVAGNDPYLLLNSADAEVTSTDYIDPLASGFTVTSSAPAELNASGGTYIFLAIA